MALLQSTNTISSTSAAPENEETSTKVLAPASSKLSTGHPNHGVLSNRAASGAGHFPAPKNYSRNGMVLF